MGKHRPVQERALLAKSQSQFDRTVFRCLGFSVFVTTVFIGGLFLGIYLSDIPVSYESASTYLRAPQQPNSSQQPFDTLYLKRQNQNGVGSNATEASVAKVADTAADNAVANDTKATEANNYSAKNVSNDGANLRKYESEHICTDLNLKVLSKPPRPTTVWSGTAKNALVPQFRGTRVFDSTIDFSKLICPKLANGQTDGGGYDPRVVMQWNSLTVQHRIVFPHLKTRPLSYPSIGEKVKGRTALVWRRDEHNPFFMVSLVHNAWILVNHWRVTDLNHGERVWFDRIVFMDCAGVAKTDELLAKMLTKSGEISYADSWEKQKKKVVEFAEAWVLPTEHMGPLMTDLNAFSHSCRKSQRLLRFVDEVFELYPSAKMVDMKKEKNMTESKRMTIVSRVDYAGRQLGRIWTNEAEIVKKMKNVFEPMGWRLDAVRFEELSMEKQIETARGSDILLGMHGAGMVHCLWLKAPDSWCVEIFPKEKKRWGYRNIAHYVDIGYAEHRQGTDGVRASKIVNWDSFQPFIKRIVSKFK